MTKRKKIFIVAIVAIIVISISALLLPSRHKEDDLLPVQLSAIKSGSGWGYEIFVDNKIFIKQECIPAVSGRQSFKNKDQALAVGNLAVKKIVNGKMPVITIKDLKTLGVVE